MALPTTDEEVVASMSDYSEACPKKALLGLYFCDRSRGIPVQVAYKSMASVIRTWRITRRWPMPPWMRRSKPRKRRLRHEIRDVPSENMGEKTCAKSGYRVH
jgi:hypothetical protein